MTRHHRGARDLRAINCLIAVGYGSRPPSTEAKSVEQCCPMGVQLPRHGAAASSFAAVGAVLPACLQHSRTFDLLTEWFCRHIYKIRAHSTYAPNGWRPVVLPPYVWSCWPSCNTRAPSTYAPNTNAGSLTTPTLPFAWSWQPSPAASQQCWCSSSTRTDDSAPGAFRTTSNGIMKPAVPLPRDVSCGISASGSPPLGRASHQTLPFEFMKLPKPVRERIYTHILFDEGKTIRVKTRGGTDKSASPRPMLLQRRLLRHVCGDTRNAIEIWGSRWRQANFLSREGPRYWP
ncbi:uncharacterized protein BDZ99DRAFT_481372 [Mytilinidion resinicola]|uniref:Uncharacterized protein n=1 Tax=Mytilinidion resinicola TaxID=574789 RepID=A0A6A6Y5Y7_9PEZI|nr:uncharacterized protein BDZ99DRAFT_481372 [Mytilinidion resinicola]KAF2804202.1 hypothetical protein BDZ99DRAFT_481372 [Mytilinidion resinicola]